MSEKIQITCPKCQTVWEKSLRELEKVEIIYRGDKENPKGAQGTVGKYRAVCPVCGTYVIIEVKED